MTKWVVVLFWLVITALAVGPSGKLTGAQENDAVNWLPASAESTAVIKATQALRPSDEVPAVLVYERPGGLTPADLQAVTAQVSKFASVESVGKPVGPVPSQDRQALEVMVPITLGSDGWQRLPDITAQLHRVAESSPPGLSMRITGPAGYASASANAFSGIEGKLLYSALAVVVVILLLTYRSPVLWLLPVASGLISLTVAQAAVYLLATKANLTVNAQSQGILTVLVFGAGTDYALLLVARYREELRRHEDRHEAMALALHRSGPAILASGSTVIAGMLCLLLASMNSTSGLGPVAAVGIVVALAVMLTLLPALLVVFGRWVFWPLRPTFGSADRAATGVWARVGKRIARRPRTTWVVTSLALAVASLGILQLDATGLQNKDAYYGKPEAVVGEEVLARHFPAGAGQPLAVIARPGQMDAVTQVLGDVPGIAVVGKPVSAGGTGYVEATLAAPADSQAAKDTVGRARDAVHGVPGADAKVGGQTAVVVDTLRASSRDNLVVIPAVLLVVLLILGLLLRAVVAPVILVATVVLSFAAAIGVSALVFKHVLGFAGTDPAFPLYVFVFLVALGIDYNIFLMTRVHEETRRVGMWQGALIGLAA
ncbi:MAG TPA: MMPL family transporter, partial [Actinomycetales bacterium]|nr:MMPL family transporter [Actinomycetales bacterium]